MEFRVDIRGDVSGALDGAAALREEAKAAREATKEIAHVGRAEAAAASARKAATPAKGQTIGQAEVASRSPWASPGAAQRKAAEEAAEKTKRSTGRDPAEDRGKAAKASAKGGNAAAIKETGAAAASSAASVLRYGAALAGIASVGALLPLAVGWRGMAALQMISYRATMDVRRLFLGLDSSPLVRAADRLEKNLSKSTVQGNALSGILQRGFGAFFGMVERGEPLLTSMFQGAVIGALIFEIAMLQAKKSFAPLVVAMEDWVGSENAMETAAYAGSVAIGAIGIAAAVAAVPVVALGAAFTSVGKAIAEAIALYREWDSDAMRKKVRKDFSFGIIDDDRDKGPGEGESADDKSWDEARRINAARAKAAADSEGITEALDTSSGQMTGQMMGAGIVAGLKDTEGAVAGAAAGLVDAANKAARSKAQAHSPAELFRRGVGKDMGDGVAIGIDDRAGAVQAAAERSMVPDQPSVGGATGGKGGATAGPVQFTYAPVYNFHGKASREDVEAADRQGFRAGLRELNIALGLPLVPA